jgi:hypothetical protein
MESVIDRVRIRSLRGHIDASRLYSVALANRFEAAPTASEKTKIARQYDAALKQTHELQLMLEMLEKQEREKLN